MDNNEDIMALQVKVAHLEQLCEEINSVVIEQADMIEYLKAKMNLTTGKIQELEMNARDGEGKGLSSIEMAAQDKPPHY